jgi:hypothetical protein
MGFVAREGPPDAVADQRLAATEFDWDRALAELAKIRGRVRGDVDPVRLVREGRGELERRP